MAAHVKVGILNDSADLSDHDDSPITGDVAGWLEREIASMRKAGRLSAGVEFLHAYGLGLPSGTAEAVENAWRDLADAGASLIIGPSIGDNALIATPLAEQMRVPTINCAAAGRARGRWMFHHQSGSSEDESVVIARHLAAMGCQRLAVIHDLSPSGIRYRQHLEDEARIAGMTVLASQGVPSLDEEMTATVDTLLDAAPDAFVHLGAGAAAPSVARALAASGWAGTRMMNTAGLRGYDHDMASVLDGWFYVDMHSDGNETLKAALKGIGCSPRQALTVARGHDIGRLVAEGLARAPDFTREGIRLGLERVKWLPAAEGHEGTLLGFGGHDRGALHGRYLVVRQWLGGETREVAR